MNVLDKLNLTENTIVVYTSDHGDLLGSQDLKFKRWPFEESINIPFIIGGYRKIKGVRQTDTVFSTIDIFPTLAGLAGIDVPGGLDGKDLSRVMLGKKSHGEPEYVYLTVCYGYVPWPGWRGIRTKDYLYARTKNKPWLLFDMRNDPYQIRNLIEGPGKRKLAKEMDYFLFEVMKKVGDSWSVNTSKGDIKNWIPPGPKFEQQNLGGSWPMG